jgi:hypothetical protein
MTKEMSLRHPATIISLSANNRALCSASWAAMTPASLTISNTSGCRREEYIFDNPGAG